MDFTHLPSINLIHNVTGSALRISQYSIIQIFRFNVVNATKADAVKIDAITAV